MGIYLRGNILESELVVEAVDRVSLATPNHRQDGERHGQASVFFYHFFVAKPKSICYSWGSFQRKFLYLIIAIATASGSFTTRW
ncbi:MAG: hypothetical protein ACYDH9_18845, partial [Limisphaerales bacterium]